MKIFWAYSGALKGTERIIERPPHQASGPVQGWRGVDNEVVNLLGTTVGALVAIVLS